MILISTSTIHLMSNEDYQKSILAGGNWNWLKVDWRMVERTHDEFLIFYANLMSSIWGWFECMLKKNYISLSHDESLISFASRICIWILNKFVDDVKFHWPWMNEQSRENKLNLNDVNLNECGAKTSSLDYTKSECMNS